MVLGETTVQTLGVAAGALGVSAAVILQMVAGRKCNPWHIAFLFSLGGITLLYNYGGYASVAYAEVTLHATAVLLTLLLEVFLIVYVYRHADAELPIGDTPALDRWLNR
jgi:hypothetical protein